MTITSEQVWQAIQPRLLQYQQAGGSLEAVAEFTQSRLSTVHTWLSGGKANGDRVIKLWHYLRTVGFRSPELEALEDYNIFLGEIYSFALIDVDGIMQALNVRNKEAVFDAFRGRKPMHPTFLLGDLASKYEAQLRAAKREVVKINDLQAPKPAVQVATDFTSAVTPESISTPGSLDLSLAFSLADKFQQGLFAVRFLASEACSDDLRKYVLGLFGASASDEIVRFMDSSTI